jgi:hypothetical protein
LAYGVTGSRKLPNINLRAGVDCRRLGQIFTTFSKITFPWSYYNQHEKLIIMSTNKPSAGCVVLELAFVPLNPGAKSIENHSAFQLI